MQLYVWMAVNQRMIYKTSMMCLQVSALAFTFLPFITLNHGVKYVDNGIISSINSQLSSLPVPTATAVTAIKYSHPQAPVPTLTLTAHRAGHVVGGSFYVLQRLEDDTKVVLTATYHIAKELHLDSSTLLQNASTPDVLVTRPGGPAFRAFHPLTQKKPGQKIAPLPPMLVTQVQRSLTENVLSVLRREGNVLLPTDAASRSLELILLLNQHWERHRLRQAYHLVWLGPMVPNTVEFARSQLEWMSARLGQAFLDSQDGSKSGHHPWALPNVKILQSVAELQTLLQQNPNPAAVVASGASLDAGPARDVLLQWADNPDNAILLTDSSQAALRTGAQAATRTTEPIEAADSTGTTAIAPAAGTTPAAVNPTAAAAAAAEEETVLLGRQLTTDEQQSPWTTAGQLLQAWGQARAAGQAELDSVICDVPIRVKQTLQGAELKAFLAREEAARHVQMEQAKEQAILREVELAKAQLGLGEDEKTTATTTAMKTSVTPTVASTRPLSFEVRETAIGIGQKDITAKYGIGESIGRPGEVVEDDYGIAALPERFTDIVSGVDPSKFGSKIGEEVLRRGFGYGVTGPKQGKTGAGGPARISEDEGDDEDDEMDEEALEALDLSEGQGIVRGRNGRPPSKVTTVWRKIEVLAEVSYIPLEGRVDAKAARQSVRALQPREIVVLGGPAVNAKEDVHDEVSLLAEAARGYATGGHPVLTPSDGETAEMKVGHAAYAVRLVDTPYVPPEETMESPPEPVELYETKLGPCTVSKLDYVATGQKVAADGSIVLAPRSASADAVPSVYLSAGDVLLTDLRAELIAQGMKAEYKTRQGFAQIIVNGHIVVKKEQNSGQMEVEGPLCEDFWTVRQVVCGQFVVL
eukprot:scaffold1351_cov176-Amphora_coffeaeformis.AAC.37